MHYKFIAFTANYEDYKIPLFGDLIRKISILNHRQNMLSVTSKIPKKARSGTLQPVLPLIPEKLPSKDEEKGSFIAFELKSRVGQPDTMGQNTRSSFVSLKKGPRNSGSIFYEIWKRFGRKTA